VSSREADCGLKGQLGVSSREADCGLKGQLGVSSREAGLGGEWLHMLSGRWAIEGGIHRHRVDTHIHTHEPFHHLPHHCTAIPLSQSQRAVW
jgi:hypothetical protein